MSRIVCWLAIALLLLIAAPAASGELLVETRRSVEVAVAPEQVLDVLADFEAWTRVLPNVEAVSAIPVAAEHFVLHYVTSTFGFDVRFTTLTSIDRLRGRVSSVLDPGADNDLQAMEAEWRVSPLAGGGSLVEFRSAVTPSQSVPGFAVRRLHARSVEQTLEGLEAELERRRAIRIAAAH